MTGVIHSKMNEASASCQRQGRWQNYDEGVVPEKLQLGNKAECTQIIFSAMVL